MTKGIGALAVLAIAASPATAEVAVELGDIAIVANGGVSITGALADRPDRTGGFRDASDIDASGSVNAEWISANGLVLGVTAAGDTADNRPDTLKNDRAFVYFASEWGRAEIGLNSGPSRRMSFAAPLVGSGQIRGDFARYANASALLWPLDTRQSFKITYFSPPVAGFRMGASWAPKSKRFGAVQKDAYEIGGQYERPFGDWVIGASGAYVHGRADAPGLSNINSWSLGAQARNGKIVLGGAYVDRGNSNRFGPNLNQSEINAGVAWRDDGWSLGASAARQRSHVRDVDFAGLGGSLDVERHITLTADVVGLRQRFGAGWSSGIVLLSGIDLHL